MHVKIHTRSLVSERRGAPRAQRTHSLFLDEKSRPQREDSTLTGDMGLQHEATCPNAQLCESLRAWKAEKLGDTPENSCNICCLCATRRPKQDQKSVKGVRGGPTLQN